MRYGKLDTAFEENIIPKTVVKYIICGISYGNLLSLSVTDVAQQSLRFQIIKKIIHENGIN